MPLDSGVLEPVSDEAPAGPDLELDPEFGELERAAQGKPEVQYGSTVEAAVPPDWREVATIARSLLTRTRDLRVLVHLAIAGLQLEGLPGFAGAVAMIRRELEARWGHVHPQLDPDDDNDPTQRSNALVNLRHPVQVLRRIRELPLAGQPRKKQVCWREIAVANGTMEPEPGQEKLTETEILGAFGDSTAEWLDGQDAALRSLLADLPEIPGAFTRNSGPATGPDLDVLLKLVRDVARDFRRYRELSTSGEEAEAEAAAAGEGEAEPESGAAAGAGAGAGRAPASGGGRSFASIQAIAQLSRREEALHALELAAAYFRRQEPSSPLPLLIDRAKRLAGMEFMDILRDLAPDGLSQAQLVAGASNE